MVLSLLFVNRIQNGKGALEYYVKQVEKNVNCLKVNYLKDGICPDDCFYDTHFHLFGNGRIERTQKLIDTIKNHAF